ncbi:uncharacterized protein LOC134221362 [Armigeres subalbatus]|uniref:uncharacterized protein LOC134221362 n=1 Tax=Armigeres subalbatus TaxID=124917 RepID=UPI002ED298FC
MAMSIPQYENSDSMSNHSNQLELVLDVFDDGTIQIVPGSDERFSIGSLYSIADSVSLPREPSIERLFQCTELKAETISPRQATMLELHPSDDDESDREPELVELCPCRNEECPTECYGKQRASGEETVMLEATMMVKIPIKRRNLERLMEIAKCCQARIR